MPSVVDRWIEQGRNEGVQQGVLLGRDQELLATTLRLLRCRVGPKAEEWYAPISELGRPQLEKLSEDLLAFRKPADIGAWLGKHAELSLEQ